MTARSVSIVIPTRDRPEFVHRAVRSALSQTEQRLEVIVVDDGSTEAYQPTSGDGRIRIVRHSIPRGVCAARNSGLHVARGQWVTFLDDDDVLLPDMLRVSLDAAATSALPAPVAVLSAIEVVRPDGRQVEVRRPGSLPRGGHYFLDPELRGHPLCQNTLVAPTEVLRSIGGFDAQLRSWVHDDLFLRLNAACSLQGVPVITYRMLDHDGRRTHRDLLAAAEAMRRTVSRHDETFRQHRLARARYLSTTGTLYLRAGRWSQALSATARAVVCHPLNGRVWARFAAALIGPRASTIAARGLRAATALRARRTAGS